MGWLRAVAGVCVGIARVITPVVRWAFTHPIASIAIGGSALAVAWIFHNQPWSGPLAYVGWTFLEIGTLGYIADWFTSGIRPAVEAYGRGLLNPMYHWMNLP